MKMLSGCGNSAVKGCQHIASSGTVNAVVNTDAFVVNDEQCASAHKTTPRQFPPP